MDELRQANVFIECFESSPRSQEECDSLVFRMQNSQGGQFKTLGQSVGIFLPKRMQEKMVRPSNQPKYQSDWVRLIDINKPLYDSIKDRLANGYYEVPPMSVTHFNGPVNAENLQTGANSNITQTFSAETITLQELVKLVKLVEEKGTPEEKSKFGTFLEGLSVAGSIEGLKLLFGG